MKAILLAGGQGTRLREISQGLPKPMMPLLGKPLLERIIELLRENGCHDLCITLCYSPERIRSYFGNGQRFGVRIEYMIEQEPLGTAGAVRNCRKFIDGDPVLVMSGDSACDFPLAELMQKHKEGISIALASHSEPLPYGLVLTDKEGRVTGFVEKPDWQRVVTDQVSTGIYVLSPDAVDRIPPTGPCDFARDLFPALLAAGYPLYGRELPGYWCDIGTPRAYYQCNLDALDGKYRLPCTDGRTSRILPCRDRARIMGAVSRYTAEFGADFSDGLTLENSQGRVHLAPQADRCALTLEGDAPAVSAMEALIRRLESNLQDP